MAHFRQTLRDTAADILTGLSTTGANVFSGRTAAMTEGELPGLVVVPSEESAAVDTTGNVTVARYLDLLVIAECVGTDGLFDLLDDISAEVEIALFAPARANLDGDAINIDPPQTRFSVGDENGRSDKRRGQMRMLFRVHYRTPQTDPTTNI